MKKHTERIEGFTRNFNEALTSLYDQGYADASKDMEDKADDAYERGCNDAVSQAWENSYELAFNDAGRFVHDFLNLDINVRTEIFKDTYLADLLEKHSLLELYNIYKRWEKDHAPDFMGGEIVNTPNGKAIVLCPGEHVLTLYDGSKTYVCDKASVIKTGKRSEYWYSIHREITKIDLDDLPF
jgi:hypothetical protein